MQKLDEQKRRTILDVAARLFATRAFHEVRLDDVAHQAHIGKGTVYIYFKSKDDLFATLVREGFDTVVNTVQRLLSQEMRRPALERIEAVLRELAMFAKTYPYVFQLMREGGSGQENTIRDIHRSREALGRLIGELIRQGVEAGELVDARPELTGQFFPACVRAAIVWGPESITVDEIVEHVMHILTASMRPAGRTTSDQPSRRRTARRPALQTARGTS